MLLPLDEVPVGTPTRRHALGRLPTPPPLPENLLLGLHQKLPSAPLRAPRRFRNPKIGQQLGAQPTPRFRVMIDALLDALLDALARCTARLPLDEVPVHVPLRRPRPLRFERLRVPVWNPYSRGRLGPAKSEDRKGGEGKTDANLTIFFSTCSALAP